MLDGLSRPPAVVGGLPGLRQGILALLLYGIAAGAAVSGISAGETSSRERDAGYYAAAELVLSAASPAGIWDSDKVRESVRVIGEAPEVVASELMWRIASAPASFDTTIFFATALRAETPDVRQVALSYLIAGGSDDSRRLLLNTLALETNPDTVRLIVRGIGSLPLNPAVRGLMDIMYLPGAKGLMIDEAATELRRLTRLTIPNHPGEWRDWWLDNEESYN